MTGTRPCTARHTCLLIACFATSLAPVTRAAAHGGGLLIQTLDDSLVTGLDDDVNNMETMGVRSFGGHFPSFNSWNNPGFLSLTEPPDGYGELPLGQDIYWDFLPMTVGGVTSNLLYWDGVGATPQFSTLTQANTTMTIFGRNNQQASANGTADMIPGKILEKTLTSTTGSLRLHAHQYWSLAVDAGSTTPAEGFYLTALQVRMDGYKTSQPFYVTWGTLNVSLMTLNDVVMPWVEQQADELVRPGDFDFDGVVDGADFLLWQRQFGQTGPFPIDGVKTDADGSLVVDAADLDVWAGNFGAGGASAAAAAIESVPEPAAAGLAALALGALALRKRVQSTRPTGRQD